MRTLNIEKNKEQKFVKTKQFLACTLLSAGLIFGSGCSDKVEQKPVVKEQVIQEQKQEINIKIKINGLSENLKVNNKNNFSVELNEGESFEFSGKKGSLPNGLVKVKLVELYLSECKLNITSNNEHSILLADGNIRVYDSVETYDIILKENGEGHYLKRIILDGTTSVYVKYLGKNKFEIFKGYDGNGPNEKLSLLKNNSFENYEGRYTTSGKKVKKSEKKGVKHLGVVEYFSNNINYETYAKSYHTINSKYENVNGKLEISNQKLEFFDPLDFKTTKQENRKEYLQKWLSKNSFVMLLGNKFKVEYLISDDNLTSANVEDAYKGVFRLTDVNYSKNLIHVTTKKTIFNSNDVVNSTKKGLDKYRVNMDEIKTSYNGVHYSNVLINGEKWKIKSLTGETGDAPYASISNTTVIMDKNMYRGFELTKL